MKEPKTSMWVVLPVFAVALIVAMLDALPQSGIPWHGLFVVPVVWIALWSAEEDTGPVTTMAIIVTLLVLLPGYLRRDPVSQGWMGDRFIVICSIWSTVVLALLRKRGRRTYKWVSLIGRR